jgi:hypothetical protein
MLIISLLTLILSYFYIYIPFRKYQEQKYLHSFHEKYRAIQLWSAQKYYDSIQNLSFEEIDKKFDTNRIYHNMGKRFVRNSGCSALTKD